jgi:hypothetical protein
MKKQLDKLNEYNITHPEFFKKNPPKFTPLHIIGGIVAMGIAIIVSGYWY